MLMAGAREFFGLARTSLGRVMQRKRVIRDSPDCEIGEVHSKAKEKPSQTRQQKDAKDE